MCTHAILGVPTFGVLKVVDERGCVLSVFGIFGRSYSEIKARRLADDAQNVARSL